MSPSSSPNATYDGGAGTDTFVQNVTADYTPPGTDPTFISLEVLVLNNGADITGMTNVQHNQFTTIIGNDIVFPLDTNSITLDDTFTGTTHDTIETYNLFASAGGQSYDIGGSNQVVNDPSTAFGDIDFLNGVANTVLNATDAAAVQAVHTWGSNSGLTINTFGGDDTIDTTALSPGSTQTALTINSGLGDDTVVVNNGTGVTIDTGTSVVGDTTILSNVTGLSLTQYGGSVSLSSVISGSASYLGGPVTTTVNAGADLSGLAPIAVFLPGFDSVVFAVGASTFNDALFQQFASETPGFLTATGIQTVTISNTTTPTFNAVSESNHPGEQIENYVLASAGDDWFNLQLAAGETTSYTLNIAAGGNDKITIDNESGEVAINRLIVTGFNVADDQIRLEAAGLANGNFQEITAANSALTVGPVGIVEINTVVGALIGQAGALDIVDGGAVESLIAGAVGAAGAGVYCVAAYASDGNAYLYQFATVATADMTTADILVVELIGQLDSVASNTLGLSNFFA